MFLFILTGSIGTGKTVVANMLRDLGVAVIDSDLIAREIVQPGEPGAAAIREEFGPSFFLSDGTLDRSALGRLVFADENARRRLNACTHPHIFRRMYRQLLHHWRLDARMVAIDIPLAFETGIPRRWSFDSVPVVCVACDEETQLARVIARDGCSQGRALQKVRSQMPTSQKSTLADRVIANNGTLDETKRQLEALIASWPQIAAAKRSSGSLRGRAFVLAAEAGPATTMTAVAGLVLGMAVLAAAVRFAL
jgi:dephospho-CoA kinase